MHITPQLARYGQASLMQDIALLFALSALSFYSKGGILDSWESAVEKDLRKDYNI
jgi:hypothetical protein